MVDILGGIGTIWVLGIVVLFFLTDEPWHTIAAWPIIAVRRAWNE